MLLVTRREEDRIHIGDNIVIVIKDIKRFHVRVGIEAPKELRIRRVDRETLSENQPARETPRDH